MTMLWACRNLSSFPDPTKSIEDQDVKLLEILMFVERTVEKEAKRLADE
ncbi:MAG: hypothetical protein KAX31_03240 [Thermoplasmata archaeon]|nr:hypothetical protein [Thermoplasmata archaeon]